MRMKKVFLAIVLIFVILIGGFFVAINMIDPKTVQDEIAKRVQELTGQALIVEQVPSISFMPLGVKFGVVSWGDKATKNISFAAQSGLVHVQFMPLLSGRVVVDELHLNSPVVNFVMPKTSKKADTKANNEALPELPLELALLVIENGQFSIQLADGQKIDIKEFNAKLTNLKPNAPSNLQLDTLLSISNPSLKGKIAFDTTLTYASSVITLQNTKLLYTPQAGLIPADMGQIDVSSKDLAIALAAIPSIKGQINIKDIKLDALMTQSSASTSAKKSQKSTAKTIYPQVDLALNLSQVSLKGINLKDIQVHAKGKGGASTVYDLNPIKFNIASGGSMHGKSNIALPSMKIQKEGTLSGLKLGPILAALQGQSPLDAEVDFSWDLNMTAVSSKQIMNTLSGKGEIYAKNINLKEGMEIPPNPIVKPVSFKTFSDLSVPFTAKNGIITITNAALKGDGVSAKGGGNVALPSESLNLKVDAAVANMIIPVTIGGTFSKPAYGVDPKWITQTLIKTGVAAPEILGKGTEIVVKGTTDTTKKVTEGAGKLIKGLFGN